MKAVGEYAVIEIKEVISSGIRVKDDGEGICISCPAFPDLENKIIIFDPNQDYFEINNYLIIHNSFILAVKE